MHKKQKTTLHLATPQSVPPTQWIKQTKVERPSSIDNSETKYFVVDGPLTLVGFIDWVWCVV